MSDAILQRLVSIARRNAAEFLDRPGVPAMGVMGSVSRGVVDRHSDIDMSVYLAALPDEGFVQREIERAVSTGGALYGRDDAGGFAVWRLVDGVKCDIEFTPLGEIDRIIRAVLVDHDLDLDKQLIIDGVRRALPFKGEAHYERWRRATDVYPPGLANAMVEKFMKVRPIWVLRGMGADRGDHLFLAENFAEIQKSILGVLYAPNRVYHPGKVKGAGRVAATLRFAPPNLMARLEGLYLQRDLHAAVDDLERLVNETHDLIDRHLSSVDTSSARRHFRLDLSNGPDRTAA